jgi:hypothetical protein
MSSNLGHGENCMKFAGQFDSGIGKGGGRGRGKRCHRSVEYWEWLGLFSFCLSLERPPAHIQDLQ